MLRTFKAALAAVLSLLVVAVTSPLLFWLGRARENPNELVVDPELIADDPGVDVDEP